MDISFNKTSADTSERVKEAAKGLGQRGVAIGSLPFGYKRVKKAEPGRRMVTTPKDGFLSGERRGWFPRVRNNGGGCAGRGGQGGHGT